MVLKMLYQLRQEIISFLDNHHINYEFTNNNIYIYCYNYNNYIDKTNRICCITATILDEIRIYQFIYNSFHFVRSVISFHYFVEYIMGLIYDYPYIIDLRFKLSILENEYKSLINTNDNYYIIYPDNILLNKVEYMKEKIGEFYIYGSKLSLYYEQLFYSIIE